MIIVLYPVLYDLFLISLLLIPV